MKFLWLLVVVDAKWIKWDPWASWSPCTASCGKATKTRSRSCPIEGKCKGKPTQRKKCKWVSCNSGENAGSWSNWSAWKSCTGTCQNAWQKRKRKCKSSGNCQGKKVSKQKCVPDQCSTMEVATTTVPSDFGESRNSIVNGGAEIWPDQTLQWTCNKCNVILAPSPRSGSNAFRVRQRFAKWSGITYKLDLEVDKKYEFSVWIKPISNKKVTVNIGSKYIENGGMKYQRHLSRQVKPGQWHHFKGPLESKENKIEWYIVGESTFTYDFDDLIIKTKEYSNSSTNGSTLTTAVTTTSTTTSTTTIHPVDNGYVTVVGQQFHYQGRRIFLNGANQAWHWYGYDFGYGNYYKEPKAAYESTIDEVHKAGGNTIRIWLHTVGEGTSPSWNDDGYVVGTDDKNTLIQELTEFLDYAETKQIWVIVSLWNGAQQKITERAIDLIWDDDKLNSYLEQCLIPMATALKSHKSLLAWEIFNEAEGLVKNNDRSDEECYDTTILKNSGAGWANKFVPMRNILRFINKQTSAIKSISGNRVLVTTGSWNERSNQGVYGFNYYKDECLIKAGGESDGILDFYQVHTYAHKGEWRSSQPMLNNKSDYKLDKPLVIGEFSASCSSKNTAREMFQHFYEGQYDGALGWQLNDSGEGHCSDGKTVILSAISELERNIKQKQTKLLPDYNDDDYEFSCKGTSCKITVSDGQTFEGVEVKGIVNFKAVPFAEPPIGPLRWKSPVLITRYDKPVIATKDGYGCATFQTVDDPSVQNQSEDCLHVNIQVQKSVLEKRQKKPIVAYIHGGAFNFGVNTDDMASLVSQGMVVVNINYRLGPYGFLTLPETEPGQTLRANWGLQDQLAALKWIKVYGGVFGGDNTNVTLDGCSAGSQSEWHHLTSPESWPYFHRAVTTGIGLAAGIYYEGEKTDKIRNAVLQHARVDDVNGLRELSTGKLRLSFVNAKNTLFPQIKSSPTLDFMYAPVIDGEMIEDHLVYLVRQGKVRPNTPISWSYAKDDGWKFTDEAWEYIRDVKMASLSQAIKTKQQHMGHLVPGPYLATYFEREFPEHALELKRVFPCADNKDCKESLGRFVQATHWYCNSRWAFNGEMKANPDRYGPLYPLEWAVPNCDNNKKNMSL